MTPAPAIHACATPADWCAQALDLIVEPLASALEANGRALLAAAGGTTPGPILAALAGRPLSWEAVTVIPTDDRRVAEDHPHRNLALLRQALNPALAVGAAVLPLEALADAPPEGGVRPDVVLLGFGLDSHIASLFPEGDAMAEAKDATQAPAAVYAIPSPLPPEAPHPRVTLNLSALLAARRIVVAASGMAKRDVFEAAQADGAPLTPLRQLLLAAGDRTHFVWRP